MSWIAAGLLVVLAVVVGAAWFGRPAKTSTGGGGPAVRVKVDPALVKQGEAAASSQGCTACHSTDGSTSVGPTWSQIYGTTVALDDGTTVKVDDTYLKTAMLDPSAQVHSGFGPLMPSYEGKLSKQDVAALIEYIKSLSG
ncbi:MAG: cytochrome c [Solirubrobacterales bacterium]